MRPKSFRLLRVNSPLLQAFDFEFIKTDETCLDFEIWDKVKQEVLGGAFNSSPGGLVAYSRLRVDAQNFTRASSMQVKYTFNEKCKMYLVHKDKWSRAELDDIATNSLYFGLNILWTLPNMDKVMSLNEAAEFTNFLCKLDSSTFDSEFLDEGEWETIGGNIWDESMEWMNPSPQRVDLVVENLKKLCSELKIELEEV